MGFAPHNEVSLFSPHRNDNEPELAEVIERFKRLNRAKLNSSVMPYRREQGNKRTWQSTIPEWMVMIEVRIQVDSKSYGHTNKITLPPQLRLLTFLQTKLMP